MVAMFFTVSVVNNYALNLNISMPLHMIFRSVSRTPAPYISLKVKMKAWAQKRIPVQYTSLIHAYLSMFLPPQDPLHTWAYWNCSKTQDAFALFFNDTPNAVWHDCCATNRTKITFLFFFCQILAEKMLLIFISSCAWGLKDKKV